MTQPVGASAVAPFQIEVVGLVLEVDDLAATRTFYDLIYQDVAGAWVQSGARLAFRTADEEIAFIPRRRPRTFTDGGHHQAYRVRRDRVASLTDQLRTRGHRVDWWREDHPGERMLSPYMLDPSGNRVQLVAADRVEQLLDHVATEVFEFDYCEYLYVTTFGASVDYYHGWRTSDLEDAQRWAEGDDPCAPWTRRDNPHYRDFLVTDPETGELRPARFAGELGVATPNRRMRVARPNGQVFLSYGATRLVLISATKVRPEAPEERVKGTPRLVFRTSARAAEAEARLATTVNPYRREGHRIYLRDADGNFAEVRCQ